MYKNGFRFEVTKNGIIGEIDGVTAPGIYSVCFYEKGSMYLRTNVYESTITNNLKVGAYKELEEKIELKINVINGWSMNDVRETCIKHNLYTNGNTREYEKMLNRVDTLEPDTMSIYEIAKDICTHSNEQTIENVMFLLRRDAIHTYYIIEETTPNRWTSDCKVYPVDIDNGVYNFCPNCGIKLEGLSNDK